MSNVVLDASIAASWCIPDENEASDWLAVVGSQGGVVPALWPFEINNVLLIACRRKRLTEPQVVRARNLLSDLPITIEPLIPLAAAADVMELASKHDLSFYDASYLELAVRRQAPLATFDQKLQRAAKAAGLQIAPGK